jgi:hypothetical protein
MVILLLLLLLLGRGPLPGLHNMFFLSKVFIECNILHNDGLQVGAAVGGTSCCHQLK